MLNQSQVESSPKRSLGQSAKSTTPLETLTVAEARKVARTVSLLAMAVGGAFAAWGSFKFGRRLIARSQIARSRIAPILNRGSGDIDVAPAP